MSNSNRCGQGFRYRALSQSFEKAFFRLASLVAKSEARSYVFGHAYVLRIEIGNTYTLEYDGDPVAVMYIARNGQWGSTKAINEAIKAVQEDEGLNSVTRFKDAITRLNNVLVDVRREHPNAGLSLSGEGLHILKDGSQVESPENILSTASLALAVRAVF